MVHLIKLSCKRNFVQQSVEKAILRYRRELQTILAPSQPLSVSLGCKQVGCSLGLALVCMLFTAWKSHQFVSHLCPL